MRGTWIAVGVVILSIGVVGFSQSRPSAKAPTGLVARGKYLVDNVANCGDCHTPRGEKGQPIMSRYLRGADMGVEPVQPNPVFTRIVPDITLKGLSGWSTSDLTKAFETGLRPDGSMFRPPMPAYKMTRRDAEAVAAYLKTVN